MEHVPTTKFYASCFMLHVSCFMFAIRSTAVTSQRIPVIAFFSFIDFFVPACFFAFRLSCFARKPEFHEAKLITAVAIHAVFVVTLFLSYFETVTAYRLAVTRLAAARESRLFLAQLGTAV